MTSEEEQRLEPAGDRLREAHFFIHQLEGYYHEADPFRWYLNAFLKALKEVPDLIANGLQNRPGFPIWYRAERSPVSRDPLIRLLADHRDLVVHRGMLLPRSKGVLGLTEGAGIKLGFGTPIDPLTDSDDAMRGYVASVQERGDFLGIITINDDDSLPCIQRRWSLDEFGDADIVDLAVSAWSKVAELMNSVVRYLGGPDLAVDLRCRHNLDGIRIRVYKRADLRAGKIAGFRLR